MPIGYPTHRRYSSIAPAPVRGFVFHALETDEVDEPDGVLIDRYPILGVVTCTEFSDDNRFDHTSIVPVVLHNPDAGEPDQDEPAEFLSLDILTETEMVLEAHAVVWCTWDQEQDEQRLEPVIRRLRKQFRDQLQRSQK